MIKNIEKYIRYLNLDIAIGACANCYFYQWVTATEVSVWIYILLFNSIWAIYTLDRIVDSESRNFPRTERHLFHKKFQRVLMGLILLLFFINIWILLNVEFIIMRNGLILAGLILLYLAAVKYFKKFVPKEVLIAILYTAGVSLGPLSLMEKSIDNEVMLYLLQHFVLAFTNLLIFSMYESGVDLKSGQFNLSLKLGYEKSVLLMRFCLTVAVILSLLFALNYDYRIALTYLAMISVLLMVGSFTRIFKIDERYRFWADAAFIIPAWLYFL